MENIKTIIAIKEEQFIIEQAEKQDIQEPTLLLDLSCFEY